MRHVIPALLLASLAASPAFATGGYTCKPVSGAGPTVSLGFGHAISSPVFIARIVEGKRTLLASADPKHPLRIRQSWIDRQHLWLDLIDAQATRFEAKLRATFQPKLRGRPAIGTLVRGGRTYRVRCEES